MFALRSEPLSRTNGSVTAVSQEPALQFVFLSRTLNGEPGVDGHRFEGEGSKSHRKDFIGFSCRRISESMYGDSRR